MIQTLSISPIAISYTEDDTTKYRFINGYDGLCMDIQDGSTANHADVQVYPYVGTNDQKWIVEQIS